MRESPPKLNYGTDAEPAGHRAERTTFWGAVLLAIAVGGMLLAVVSAVISLVAAAAIIIGLVLVIGTFVGPSFNGWYGAGGVALIVIGSVILWLLHRYGLAD